MNKRASNIELLRIIAMVLIIFRHLTKYGFFYDELDDKFNCFGYSKATKLATYLSNKNSPIQLFTVTCILCVVLNLKPFTNTIINIFSSSTFGIYLLHNNAVFIYFLWHKIYKTQYFAHSPYLFIYILCVIVSLYIVGTAIDLIRQKLFKVIFR